MKHPFLDLGAVNLPYLDQLKAAATRVIESGRYIGGPEVEAFEEKMQEVAATRYAIGVSNGLDALRLILRGYKELGRLRDGDGVIVAGNTYIASILAIVDAGLTPILVDPDPLTLNLSAEGILEGLKHGHAKAIMPVHLYGRLAWDSEMASLAQRNHLLVVEDVAQAIGVRAAGAFSAGEPVAVAGGLGDAGAFSFYPTKNIGALGDAGAVTTSHHDLAEAVRALANYGSDRRYHNIYAGFNCRLDPLQAALICVKLQYLDQENQARRQRAELYHKLIKNPDVKLPPLPSSACQMVWHQFVVTTPHRDNLARYLRHHGVATDINYPTPPHLQPCFEGREPFASASLPITERLCKELLCLPISSATPLPSIHHIAQTINDFSPTSL